MKKGIFSLILCLMVSFAAQAAGEKELFVKASDYLKRKDDLNAAVAFHRLAYSRNVGDEQKQRARYFLGVALTRLNLKQVASYPLVLAVKEGPSAEVRKRSLDLLIGISRKLKNRELLNYALEKAKIEDVSEVSQAQYYLLMADKESDQGKFDNAIQYATKALALNPNNIEAIYVRSLLALQAQRPAEARVGFEKMLDLLSKRGPTDPQKGLAQISIARALYQEKRFADAVEKYRVLAKDNPLYREAQMELAWANFMSAKFRSSLSTIQTVQNPFYENYWEPESLILRSLIALFVCQYGEVENTLKSFDRLYMSSYHVLLEVSDDEDLSFFAREVDKSRKHLSRVRAGTEGTYDGKVPFFLTRTLLEGTEIKQRLAYLEEIEKEKKVLDSKKAKMGSLGKMAEKVLDLRMKKVRTEIATQLRTRIQDQVVELSKLSTQREFIYYEMLNAKRTELKKKIENKAKSEIDEKTDRNVLIENGYRYWPFQNEVWRDEIGNYQYFGQRMCND